MKVMRSLFVAVCVFLFVVECQGQLSYSYHRVGRDEISDDSETLAAPYKVILHNRRFLKVPSNRNFRPAYDSMVRKDSLESDTIFRTFLRDQEAK
ncbi:hypothetical protein AWC38_SpisGene14575 [Stylophora pistillata]|uniref:Uncharacterized protein n=1 Tax=Stylophora pistillata TaxID=50429 RepID=A0A2B4RX75_STYPI|nr:hypothetical protein AWC38_SpisGene14575 [Stylophora pistillata]